MYTRARGTNPERKHKPRGDQESLIKTLRPSLNVKRA
jgi:hypothetical protein